MNYLPLSTCTVMICEDGKATIMNKNTTAIQQKQDVDQFCVILIKESTKIWIYVK